MTREFLQKLASQLPQEAVDAIMEANGRDIQAARQSAQDWEDKYNQAVEDHAQQLRQVRFDAQLQRMIRQFGGRNEKAVAALLDIPGLQSQEDPVDAMEQALRELKKEHDYLFQSPTPPVYAAGTGTAQTEPVPPQSLAEALKEKFERR